VTGALAVFALLWAAALLLLVGRPAWRLSGARSPGAFSWALLSGRGVKAKGQHEDLHAVALMVAQLSALLTAGRTPSEVWRQAADQAETDGAEAVLRAAARAASLGLPVAPAIRAAAVQPDRARSHRGGTSVWEELAGCVEAAETTGCPLAVVLDRLSAHVEDDADAAAARATALAGPKATAQILTVLPAVGLVVGALIGTDPLGVLLETPLGLLCLVAGAALALAGRAWSARLVLRAGELR
jgi:tight adherence protein B